MAAAVNQCPARPGHIDARGSVRYRPAFLKFPRAWVLSACAIKVAIMANTPGAKKAIRKIQRRTEVNKARRSRVRTYIRKFEEALEAGDAGVAKTAFVEAQSELMRAVGKGVVHKNTGARKVSRLAAQLKKLAAA
ncbi:MAG: ribosomal protein [Caulobacteraceae bacterium]|nr:ribosomal protein [Caulobacteraceae bacterium]